MAYYNYCSNYYSSSSSSEDESDYDLETDRYGYVDVYTDGACPHNGYPNARAGIGVWFDDDHELNVSCRLKGRQTNNRAEIKAVTFACRQAKLANVRKLRINTDSQFLHDCINKWMDKWRRNGWRTSSGKAVVHKRELLEMEDELDDFDEITWNIVRSHQGIYGNEMADKLAREGANMPYN